MLGADDNIIADDKIIACAGPWCACLPARVEMRHALKEEDPTHLAADGRQDLPRARPKRGRQDHQRGVQKRPARARRPSQVGASSAADRGALSSSNAFPVRALHLVCPRSLCRTCCDDGTWHLACCASTRRGWRRLQQIFNSLVRGCVVAWRQLSWVLMTLGFGGGGGGGWARRQCCCVVCAGGVVSAVICFYIFYAIFKSFMSGVDDISPRQIVDAAGEL